MDSCGPREVIERGALQEHEAVRGRCFRVPWVYGYKGEDSVDVHLDPPVLVRILKTSEGDVCHWNDEWLDPFWDVEVLEQRQELEDVRSTWVHGTSYSIAGDQQAFEGVPVHVWWEAARDALRGLIGR